jgi:hypothetical protein
MANKTGVSERNSSSAGDRALRAADSGGRGAHLVKLLGARSETRVSGSAIRRRDEENSLEQQPDEEAVALNAA